MTLFNQPSPRLSLYVLTSVPLTCSPHPPLRCRRKGAAKARIRAVESLLRILGLTVLSLIELLIFANPDTQASQLAPRSAFRCPFSAEQRTNDSQQQFNSC